MTKLILHRPLYLGICACLKEIFEQNRYADKVIEWAFKHHRQWGSRDRALVAEAVYTIVRNWRLYTAICECESKPWQPDTWDQCLQVYYLLVHGRVPEFNWVKPINPEIIYLRQSILIKNTEYKYSVPDWLFEYGVNQLGQDTWVRELAAMHYKAPITLRTNTLKVTKEELTETLIKEGLECQPVELVKHGIKLIEGRNIFKLPAFHRGWFEAQDAGSQMVSEFCAPHLGSVVIDACAGAGGKTLHLAALLKNKGKVIALDVSDHKLNTLKQRARRAGAFNIETRLIRQDKVIKKLNAKADLVLLDAPCSGSGVWRRNPDAKWKSSPETIHNLLDTQKTILDHYSGMVKPGGTLVYATCSLFPSENKLQVAQFLNTHPEFSLHDQCTLTPANNDTDGFFMASLNKEK